MPKKDLNLLIVTGLSGAGKSTVMKSLEDLGFYCIDNLPIKIFDYCLDHFQNDQEKVKNLALVIDARESSENMQAFSEKIVALKKLNVEKIKLVYLEASKDVLMKRFHLTRRRHPMDQKGDLDHAIEDEKKILKPLKTIADHQIDSSTWNVHELKRHCMEIFPSMLEFKNMFISVMSFGFKNGLPHNADLVFDVRFVDNPYFEEDLKHLCGLDQVIKDYVLKQNDAKIYLQHILDLLIFSIPKYQKEPKAYLTIAIGCTGGQHRSVVLAEEVFKVISKMHKSVSIKHRDVEIAPAI